MNVLRTANEVVQSVLSRLPPEIRSAAEECQILFEEESEDSELLGLFEGLDRGSPPSPDPEDWPRITLFLQTIWEESDENSANFREEVKITFLHELGHYLGMSEEAVESLGLR